MKKTMLQTILLCCLCVASCSDIEDDSAAGAGTAGHT